MASNYYPTDMFSSLKVIIFYDCPKSIVSGRTIHVSIVSVMYCTNLCGDILAVRTDINHM